MKRDDWMLGPGASDGRDNFSSFTNKNWGVQKQVKENTKEPSAIIEKVLSSILKNFFKISLSMTKPGQSSLELNPYWKDGGTGLPPEEKPAKSRFLRPGDDSPPPSRTYFSKPRSQSSSSTESTEESFGVEKPPQMNAPEKSYGVELPSTSNMDTKPKENATEPALHMTRDEMNRLGAQIMKAELMGDKVTAIK